MTALNFEKNLPHQQRAIQSTIKVFCGAEIEQASTSHKPCINPLLNRFNTSNWFYDNLQAVQSDNGITQCPPNADSNIIDIMMETGTGKTYTYTKTIFELNKHYGIFKFIIVVPTLSIKAGTINFLKSASCRSHFKEQYHKSIKLHIVESQKSRKNHKNTFPPSIRSFINTANFDKNSIQVMIINTGMLNSKTMESHFDQQLLDSFNVPFEAISAVHPFMIIDEPHKFAHTNKTWENIKKLNPQYILRYGATFPEKYSKRKNPLNKKQEKIAVKDYHNLIYQLSAVDSFNQNLVKGIIGHISEFEQGENCLVKLVNSNGTEATFELINDDQKSCTKPSIFKLEKKQSLANIHHAMQELTIENINKSVVLLSNGLALKKGDKINPFSYAQTLQEIMLAKAVKMHFQLEKQLLNREVKIKPLTLFFIDNIEAYRKQDGYLKTTLERLIKAEVTHLLKQAQSDFYQQYLQQTLDDLSQSHGGYFSKDNSEKDEKIEQQVNEILHDKQALLSLDNSRRFIFSKWTLREGWDNPNVFQICKLRSSGSDISKLQEVGRGLRLPINEYGNRVKNEQFYLNYFVDFTESDFIDQLIAEINQKSGVTKDIHRKVNAGVNDNKIYQHSSKKQQVINNTKKECSLKPPSRQANKKAVPQYNFNNESEFQALLVKFFISQQTLFTQSSIKERTETMAIDDAQAVVSTQAQSPKDNITPFATMSYSDFLNQLASQLSINLKSIHQALVKSHIDINPYLNPATIRHISHSFNNYLLYNALDK